MALTSEDIRNQKFVITKFRDGYDMDQVDDFLDRVGEDLNAHEAEKAQLIAQIEELTQQLEECRANAQQAQQAQTPEPITPPEPAPVPAAPQAAPVDVSPGATADAVKSSAMLQLALELHDKHVKEGEDTRDQLVSEGERKARELVEEAESQRSKVLSDMNAKRLDLQNRIAELRDFESEYRGTLKSYIEAQLRNLDGNQEPGGSPESLN